MHNRGRRLGRSALGRDADQQLLGQSASLLGDEGEDDAVTEEGAPITVREPLVRTIADIYRLTKDQLVNLDRIGEIAGGFEWQAGGPSWLAGTRRRAHARSPPARSSQ